MLWSCIKSDSIRQMVKIGNLNNGNYKSLPDKEDGKIRQHYGAPCHTSRATKYFLWMKMLNFWKTGQHEVHISIKLKPWRWELKKTSVPMTTMRFLQALGLLPKRNWEIPQWQKPEPYSIQCHIELRQLFELNVATLISNFNMMLTIHHAALMKTQ